MAHVMTVRGPVNPDSLGKTLTHEHIFWDARRFWDPSELSDPEIGARAPFEANMGGPARWNGSAYREDLYADPEQDYAMVREEVAEFVAAGGGCIVELTTAGIAPAPAALKRLSDDLDLHIVEGCGWYVHDSHPQWLETASVEDIAQKLLDEVRNGFGESGVRPGIIGELGTSEQLVDCEERVLRAAAQVARETGTAINIHANPPPLAVMTRVLDILEEEGHDLQKTSVSHLDEVVDLDYHRNILDRGVTTGFDSFGQDGYFTPSWKSLSDLEKATTLSKLIELGYEDQLVVSQDMGKKHYLLRFGGMGYDHVLRRVMPRLKSVYGVSDNVLDKLLVANPRRLLSRIDDAWSTGQ